MGSRELFTNMGVSVYLSAGSSGPRSDPAKKDKSVIKKDSEKEKAEKVEKEKQDKEKADKEKSDKKVRMEPMVDKSELRCDMSEKKDKSDKKDKSPKKVEKVEPQTDVEPSSVVTKKEKKKKEQKKRQNLIASMEQTKSVAEEKAESKPEKEDFSVFEKKLREFDFYHGFIPREDLHTMLIHSGDYLLRVSEIHEAEGKVKREMILSLIPVDGKDADDKKKIRHVVIKRASSNMYFCEPSHVFESITDLITYYKKNTGLCSSATFQLKNPILIQSWEFMHSDVTIGKVLGEGAFGKVCSGTLKLKDGTTVEVAIKMTKVSAFLSKMKIKEMMNEARIIRNFNHKNVVRLYGVAHDEQPLYILLELVRGGSLQDFLKESKAKGNGITMSERLKFCVGVARGIEHLHENNCIHRDIAARNCLLSDKDRNREIKITDFGLSRPGPSYRIKTSCKLPVKWLAPETISGYTFSFATDVYSWGITCFEIFADGVEPFNNMTNAQCKADVVAGKFLKMPDGTPEAVKTFIAERIFVEPAKRATITVSAIEFEMYSAKAEMGTLEATSPASAPGRYRLLRGWRPRFK